jgi:hypothetical protein
MRIRRLRCKGASTVTALAAAVSLATWAAEPTPDPAEPTAVATAQSIGLDVRVAHDGRPARQVVAGELPERFR